ncbi:MAG: acyl dehydratase [Actinomycetes bacterium]|jgi:acyl dehydratase
MSTETTVKIPGFDSVSVGDTLGPTDYPIQRINLVMYCGASGDFNFIHWHERTAKAVGLPDVIAHGMFTMAEAGRTLTDFAGDPSRVREFGVRFSRPVVVPDDDVGTVVTVTGVITEKRDDKSVVIVLTAVSAEREVLGKARGVVSLA